MLVVALLTAPTVSAAEPPVQVTAELAGRPIPLIAVAEHHCHDLDFPRIRCFQTAAELSAALELNLGLLSLAATSYVQVYEYSWYGGSSMVMSQDYSVLAWIGWNDRISSFRALNSETGSFHWDWFYGGGTPYTFCCNQNVSSLGIWNDNISSVRRT
ncbi:MAG: hypothetical protein AB1736_13765 [Chloroflexota bacterium]